MRNYFYMSQNVLIGIIAGVVVAGGGAYLYLNRDATDSSDTLQATATQNDTAAEMEDFKAIVASGKDVTCDVAHTDGTQSSEGTIYVAEHGTKVYADFRVTAPKAGEIHVLRRDNYNYAWGPQMPYGVKTAVTEATELFAAQAGADTPIPEGTTFSCTTWHADESRFLVPQDVEFHDMSAQMKAMTDGAGIQGEAGASGSVDAQAMRCGACAQAGEHAAECRAAFHCE
jgi:hypothetical protein